MNKQLITYIGAHHRAMESIYNLSYQLGKQTCLLRNSLSLPFEELTFGPRISFEVSSAHLITMHLKYSSLFSPFMAGGVHCSRMKLRDLKRSNQR